MFQFQITNNYPHNVYISQIYTDLPVSIINDLFNSKKKTVIAL